MRIKKLEGRQKRMELEFAERKDVLKIQKMASK